MGQLAGWLGRGASAHWLHNQPAATRSECASIASERPREIKLSWTYACMLFETKCLIFLWHSCYNHFTEVTAILLQIHAAIVCGGRRSQINACYYRRNFRPQIPKLTSRCRVRKKRAARLITVYGNQSAMALVKWVGDIARGSATCRPTATARITDRIYRRRTSEAQAPSSGLFVKRPNKSQGDANSNSHFVPKRRPGDDKQ